MEGQTQRLQPRADRSGFYRAGERPAKALAHTAAAAFLLAAARLPVRRHPGLLVSNASAVLSLQVHAAELLDGRKVAMKVQYPGVGRSIESDIDNVMRLIKVCDVSSVFKK